MKVDIVNPATGKVDRSQPLMDAAAVEAVLAASQPAFRVWSARPLAERGELLRRVGSELRRRRDDIQRVMTAEMGKLRKEALAEIDKCAGACDYYANHAADYLRDEPINTDGSRSYVRYEPIGCVFAVMPWNFPIWQVFRFLAPALMAGNVAVLKHASNVPGCADVIADALHGAGVPAGVFGVLHIDNDQAAEVIRDPRVAAVTLTGSERAGRSVAGNAGQQLKKCVMELGGSDAFVVLEDADLDKTVAGAIASRFGNAGQTCIAAKRFIVVEAIADRFVQGFSEAAAKLRLGDPQDDATTLAPMARQDLRDELHRQVQASIARGAKALLGCEPDASHAGYPASILDGVKPGMPAYEEELFGPVASILRVRDEAEAVRVANDTTFGLGGSVWTGNADRGDRVARQLQVGAAFVNAIVRSDVRLPFGGTKRSGFGRELAEHGIHEFMNIKSVYVA
ncbi:NAD-dependent succinate-semialdehyde dehydrogenase [Pseudoxanthomonas sp. OG2]|uniref:NAD-dependent succinate-semialdehyde dehydrogenase n=1 Tax=Pseudoxanthomonas sp. OG2 TaxID=2587011 RepID=UPI00161A270F|nr:NAD-dependent succinate-semialdehyde dehydrogenase [Pseudoxanthomonas sp. OG2]MBB3274931.1 succinate-semialdehyde dehydrogenase/glutarate-semialdehyde dehydrogenase [Pseudoxanthomonas sp. OG2]